VGRAGRTTGTTASELAVVPVVPEQIRRADPLPDGPVRTLQSLATLEAIAAGTLVVAADAMALPHLVHQGCNGWALHPR